MTADFHRYGKRRGNGTDTLVLTLVLMIVLACPP